MKYKVYNALLVMNDSWKKVFVFILKKGHTNKRPKVAYVLQLVKWKVR